MRHVALLLGLLALSACGSPPAGPGAPGPVVEDPLRGMTFLLDEATVNGEPKTLVAGTEVSLRFTDDGRLIANAGCNSMIGPVRVADNRLSADLSTTEMGCAPDAHEQDGWLGQFLADGPTVRLDGAELVLTGSDTTLVLTEKSVADPDRPLVGTEWTVNTLIDGQTASSTPAGAPPATLVFAEDRVTVATGCNTGSATYQVSDQTISFGPLVLTRKGCPGDIMALETAVVDVVRDEVAFEVESDTLSLNHPSGKGLRLRAE